MRSERTLQNEIREITTLQGVIESYEEIAAMRMRKIKNQVLSNRDFFGGLADVYRQVEHTYRVELVKLFVRRKKARQDVSIDKKDKTVSVVLTANTGFYGNIVRDTFNHFISQIDTKKTDVVVVGKVGSRLYSFSRPDDGFKYFDLDDSETNSTQVSEIVNYLKDYDNIVVYHGKFESILQQKPVESYVSGDLTEFDQMVGNEATKSIECIFEPSLDDVVTFFETQLLSSLFEQSVYEHTLSKYTSRMVNLDGAIPNIKEVLRRTVFERQKFKHKKFNGQQLNVLASMSLWGA